jgi:hypothetical protein
MAAIRIIKISLLFRGTVIMVLCLTTCSFLDVFHPNTENNGLSDDSRIFNVQRGDNAEWYVLTASKRAEGTYCVVYVSDTELELVSPSLARYIAAEFDDNIYEATNGVFGDYMAAGFDVDGNGKIILLLLDILDGYSGGAYVAGYFNPTHMYGVSTYSGSNHADMLFIDVNPQRPGSRDFFVTIVHEFQHLINFAMHNGMPQETWLNEGLSSAAEYLYGGHQWSRFYYFNADPMGTIAQGNNFFVWKGHWENEDEPDSLANYSTVYLFFQWLRIQGGGPSIYTDIAGSKFRDYRALTRAAKDRIPGIAEADDGTAGLSDEEIWSRLLSSWMIANYRNDPDPSSLYGYKGEWLTAELRKHIIASSLPVLLFPGEGVFSGTQGSANIPDKGGGPHISYVRISTDTDLPVGNNILLSYNANTKSTEYGEEAYVYAGTVNDQLLNEETATGRSALPLEALPESYPIGIHDLPSRRAEDR